MYPAYKSQSISSVNRAKITDINNPFDKNHTTILNLQDTAGLQSETVESPCHIHQLYLNGNTGAVLDLIQSGIESIEQTMRVRYEFESNSENLNTLNTDSYDWGCTSTYDEITLLHLAVLHNDLPFAKQLVELGASLDATATLTNKTYIQMHTALGEPVNWETEYSENTIDLSLIKLALSNESIEDTILFLKDAGYDFSQISQSDFEYLDDYSDDTNNVEIAEILYNNCDWENIGINPFGLLGTIICEKENVCFGVESPGTIETNDIINVEDNILNNLNANCNAALESNYTEIESALHLPPSNQSDFDQMFVVDNML